MVERGLEFKATKEQVLEIACRAVNASVPMGSGFIHFQNRQYLPSDVGVFFKDGKGIEIDYFAGRMVKLYIDQDGEETWLTRCTPRIDYQSWALKYPTFKDLCKGILKEDVWTGEYINGIRGIEK